MGTKKNEFFTIFNENNRARTGKITTEHGNIFTPAFLFCGTQGTIKTLENYRLRDLKTQILLCNTFHLLEGQERIVKAGGIHKFIGWDGPILTDSGGYQVFSLGFGSVSEEIKGTRKQKSSLVKINDEKVTFRNPRNGVLMELSPEISIKLQCDIGVDFVVSMDECTPYHFTYQKTKKSMRRSIDWGKKSINFFLKYKKPYQKLYGIVQGGIHKDLRLQSIDFLKNNVTDCIAIGGSLGKNKEEMKEVVNFTMENLSKDGFLKDKPVHLLGIGDKIDIIHAVDQGVDTFDCVSPTRLSRHCIALLSYIKEDGTDKLNLKKSIFKEDFRPLEDNCECFTCTHYTRAYIHYLIQKREQIYANLICAHNIFAVNKFMHEIRKEILSDNWQHWKTEQLKKFGGNPVQRDAEIKQV